MAANSFGQAVYGATANPRYDAKEPTTTDPWNTSVSAGFYDSAGNFTPNLNYNQQTGGWLWGPDAGPRYGAPIAQGAAGHPGATKDSAGNYGQPAGNIWSLPGYDYNSYYTKGTSDANQYSSTAQPWQATQTAPKMNAFNPTNLSIPSGWQGPNGWIDNPWYDASTGGLRRDASGFAQSMGISDAIIPSNLGYLINGKTKDLDNWQQYVKDTTGQLDSDYYNELLGSAQRSKSAGASALADFLGGIKPNTTLSSEQQQQLKDLVRGWASAGGALGNIENQLSTTRSTFSEIPADDYWSGSGAQSEDWWRAKLGGNFEKYAPVLPWYSASAPTGGLGTTSRTEAAAASDLSSLDLNTLLSAMGSMYSDNGGGSITINTTTGSSLDPTVLAMLMSGLGSRSNSNQQVNPYGMGPNSQPMSSYAFTY